MEFHEGELPRVDSNWTGDASPEQTYVMKGDENRVEFQFPSSTVTPHSTPWQSAQVSAAVTDVPTDDDADDETDVQSDSLPPPADSGDESRVQSGPIRISVQPEPAPRAKPD
jgi:hypothetical protein